MKSGFSYCLFLLLVLLVSGCAIRQGSKRTAELPVGPPARTAKLSAPPIAIAVLDFQNVAGDPELDYLVRAIPETIVTHLAGSEKLAFVERAALQQILKESKLNRTGVVDDQTVVMAGRAVGAKVVVTGSVVRIGAFVQTGNAMVVTIRLIDVQTLRLRFWEQVRGVSGVEILNLIDGIAVRLPNYIAPPQIHPLQPRGHEER